MNQVVVQGRVVGVYPGENGRGSIVVYVPTVRYIRPRNEEPGRDEARPMFYHLNWGGRYAQLKQLPENIKRNDYVTAVATLSTFMVFPRDGAADARPAHVAMGLNLVSVEPAKSAISEAFHFESASVAPSYCSVLLSGKLSGVMRMGRRTVQLQLECMNGTRRSYITMMQYGADAGFFETHHIGEDVCVEADFQPREAPASRNLADMAVLVARRIFPTPEEIRKADKAAREAAVKAQANRTKAASPFTRNGIDGAVTLEDADEARAKDGGEAAGQEEAAAETEKSAEAQPEVSAEAEAGEKEKEQGSAEGCDNIDALLGTKEGE